MFYQQIKFFFTAIYIFYIQACLMPLLSILMGSPSRAHEFWTRAVAKSMRVSFRYIRGSSAIQKHKRVLKQINYDRLYYQQITALKETSFFMILSLIIVLIFQRGLKFMVAIIFPFTFIVSKFLCRTVWFFRRGNNNLPQFFKWVDYNFSRAIRPNLVVYPEGHRMNNSSKSAPLKMGMIQYAYERNLDVQIVIAFGQEDVFNEKQLYAYWGPSTITVFIDRPFDTNSFDNFQDFYDFIQQRFTDLFDSTYDQYKLSQQD